MPKLFDREIDRKKSDSIKWNLYDSDVLPMWVADMDFAAPPTVIQALKSRVEHGVFGYAGDPVELRRVIIDRLAEKYGWSIKTEDIVFTPGVVVGFNIAAQAVSKPGGELIIQPPVYPPFFKTGSYAEMVTVENPLIQDGDGYYRINFNDFEQKITEKTCMFLLCNPHNPVGRVFKREELERLAEICLRHNVVICSDEIHGDLIFKGHQHVPLASISPDIANKTITLMAPSKTFNIAGLDCSFAIIQNKELREQYLKAMKGITGNTNMLGITAALAAYQTGDPWLEDLMMYLQDNRDYLKRILDADMPEIKMVLPEGTYLAWLDCRQAGLKEAPYDFFLKNARVAFNNGDAFGSGGKGFVRMNFGCTRVTLNEALNRMKLALQKVKN